MINRINGNIVLAGSRGNVDAYEAIPAIEKYILETIPKEQEADKMEMGATVEHGTKIISARTLTSMEDKIVEEDLPKIELFYHPLEPGDWKLHLDDSTLEQEDRSKKRLYEKQHSLLVRATINLPYDSVRYWQGNESYMVYADPINACERIFEFSNGLWKTLRQKGHKDKIAKQREIMLMFDNGYRLFLPRQFRGYIERNKGKEELSEE